MKVLLVDDHPLFLEGLRHLLTLRGIEVLDTARDGLEAIDKARALRPEVILMDIRMPRLDGLAATRRIKAELPDVKIVMLTDGDADLFEAFKSGASGYLLKTQDSDELFAMLHELSRGEVVLSAGLAERILQQFGRLMIHSGQSPAGFSARETQVLSLVAQGLTYKEAGAKLFLSERTIKFHMGRIIERLHLKNRAEVIAYAKDASMTELPDVARICTPAEAATLIRHASGAA